MFFLFWGRVRVSAAALLLLLLLLLLLEAYFAYDADATGNTHSATARIVPTWLSCSVLNV